MKLRIAALALALAFVAAPALAALAKSCPPCAEMSDAGPCTSLAAVSCCSDVASTPVKSTLDTPSVKAIADSGYAVLVPAYTAPPRASVEIAARISPARLSVVRRL